MLIIHANYQYFLVGPTFDWKEKVCALSNHSVSQLNKKMSSEQWHNVECHMQLNFIEIENTASLKLQNY